MKKPTNKAGITLWNILSFPLGLAAILIVSLIIGGIADAFQGETFTDSGASFGNGGSGILFFFIGAFFFIIIWPFRILGSLEKLKTEEGIDEQDDPQTSKVCLEKPQTKRGFYSLNVLIALLPFIFIGYLIIWKLLIPAVGNAIERNKVTEKKEAVFLRTLPVCGYYHDEGKLFLLLQDTLISKWDFPKRPEEPYYRIPTGIDCPIKALKVVEFKNGQLFPARLQTHRIRSEKPNPVIEIYNHKVGNRIASVSSDGDIFLRDPEDRTKEREVVFKGFTNARLVQVPTDLLYRYNYTDQSGTEWFALNDERYPDPGSNIFVGQAGNGVSQMYDVKFPQDSRFTLDGTQGIFSNQDQAVLIKTEGLYFFDR